MAQANYGIVDWYLAKEGFRFEDFKGRTREEVLDASSDEFFDKVMNYAKDKAQSVGKSNTMDYLKNNTKFRNKSIDIIKNDNRMISGSDEWFDNHITKIINNSKLVKTRKEELLVKVKDYQSEDDIENDIQEGIRIVEQVKSDFKSATTIEEREEAIYKLKSESPKTYNALRGWETRRGPKAIDYIFSQLD